MTTIDILHLIDRLEELIVSGWRLPGKRVAIEEPKCLDLIDQMRITIPPEIKQAREILGERDRFFAQAHEEARQVLAQARADSSQMLDELKLRQAAEEHADGIRRRAEDEARQVREGADQYAETRLREMRETLNELQHVVQNGIDELARRRAERLEAEARTSLLDSPEPPPDEPAESAELTATDEAPTDLSA